MARRGIEQFRRAGVQSADAPVEPRRWRWYVTAGLLLSSIILLTLSFAPIWQFYLSWVGLVPWLLVVRNCRSQRAAFFWSWGAGTLFFVANMWWLAYVTAPGMIALLAYLGLSWGVAAVVIRGAGVLKADGKWKTENGKGGLGPFAIYHFPFSIFGVAIVWAGCEWFRGNYPFNGLPWLYLGHAQTPIPVMCQVADVLGVYGVSFWVAMVNALVALLVIERLNWRRVAPAGLCAAGVVLAVLGYGLFRLMQQTTYDGPTVLVVQPNYPQSNTGEKGASFAEIVDFHVETTRRAAREVPGLDLIVWSETMMPELNREARAIFRGEKRWAYEDYGMFLDQTYQRLQNLAAEFGAGLLAGGQYFDARRDAEGEAILDSRNSAYFFERTGLDSGTRYDKIHLVPFGEYIPFKDSIPALYRLFLELGPYDYDYTLTPGKEPATVFTLAGDETSGPWRFVVPICFEDIDSALVARMLHSRAGGKRADFIVNITNDGWFKANEPPQHLQAAVFRSIENRVPTARSVNTGMSGFIDSNGRVDPTKLAPQDTEGWSAATLKLDRREAPYTTIGDVFAIFCAIVTAMVATTSLIRWGRTWHGRPRP